MPCVNFDQQGEEGDSGSPGENGSPVNKLPLLYLVEFNASNSNKNSDWRVIFVFKF